MGPAEVKHSSLDEIFDSFNKAWMKYWDSYVSLQNQLYESLRAARELQWLAATDPEKLSEVNNVQRELFASMPRRLDYAPLSQVSEGLESALSRISEMEAALSSEDAACKKLEEAILSLGSEVKRMKESLRLGS
jgi:hypothetical protein